MFGNTTASWSEQSQAEPVWVYKQLEIANVMEGCLSFVCLNGKKPPFPIHRNIKFQNLQIILYISVKKVLNPILPQCNEGLFKTFLAMCIHSDPVFMQTTSSMQLLFCPVLKILSLYPCPVQPPTTSSASTSSSICSLFLCLSISVPWFPWDWILSQIILEGSLSSIDPLGSTALCRGSEVWRMWCMWPMG